MRKSELRLWHHFGESLEFSLRSYSVRSASIGGGRNLTRTPPCKHWELVCPPWKGVGEHAGSVLEWGILSGPVNCSVQDGGSSHMLQFDRLLKDTHWHPYMSIFPRDKLLKYINWREMSCFWQSFILKTGELNNMFWEVPVEAQNIVFPVWAYTQLIMGQTQWSHKNMRTQNSGGGGGLCHFGQRRRGLRLQRRMRWGKRTGIKFLPASQKPRALREGWRTGSARWLMAAMLSLYFDAKVMLPL